MSYTAEHAPPGDQLLRPTSQAVPGLGRFGPVARTATGSSRFRTAYWQCGGQQSQVLQTLMADRLPGWLSA